MLFCYIKLLPPEKKEQFNEQPVLTRITRKYFFNGARQFIRQRLMLIYLGIIKHVNNKLIHKHNFF